MARFIIQDIQDMVDVYIALEERSVHISKVGKDYTPSKAREAIASMLVTWAKTPNVELAKALKSVLEKTRGMPFDVAFRQLHGYVYLLGDGSTFEEARKRVRRLLETPPKDPQDPFWSMMYKEHRHLFISLK